MEARPKDPALEIKRLQRCINDLVSLLALPAVWSGSETSQIGQILLDALLRMLNLDLIYARMNDLDLRSIINMIPTLAWSAGPDGSVDFLSRRWLDYTGLSAGKAQGWGWQAAIHPDDVRGLFESWQSCLVSGRPVEAEARMRRFDGAYRWFLFRANPLRDDSGNIVKWYGTNIDVEDRRRGEEALRASELSWRQVVDNIPGLVATMGAMGEVEFLNRQTLEYFGRASEELKNWALIEAVHPDDLPV